MNKAEEHKDDVRIILLYTALLTQSIGIFFQSYDWKSSRVCRLQMNARWMRARLMKTDAHYWCSVGVLCTQSDHNSVGGLDSHTEW